MSDLIKKRCRRIDAIGASVLVVAVACTGLFGVYPLWLSNKANEAEMAGTQHDLDQLEGLSRTVAQVDAELRNTQNRLKEAEASLPNSDSMGQFMSQVAGVAEAAGLKVDGITRRQLQQADNYRVMPVEIVGTGSWETCYKFLVGLRKMNRVTRLDDLVLELDNSNPEQTRLHPELPPSCRLSVSISTFMTR
jgi:Tfp pilus assembly protein PilO